ncbi:MAG: hypothetical protein AAGN35_27810 [Bacteroidota bacterium]
MLALVNVVASLLGTRTGRLLAIPLLAVALLTVFTATRKIGRQRNPPPVISLLQEVQYMQQLEVIHFYSQHVLMLGDPSLLQEMALAAGRDTLRAQETVGERKIEMIRRDAQRAEAGSRLLTAEDSLADLHDTLEILESDYELLRQRDADLATQLAEMEASERERRFSPEFVTAWQAHHRLTDSTAERRFRRRARKGYRDALRTERRRLRDQILGAEKLRAARELELGWAELQRAYQQRQRKYAAARTKYETAMAELGDRRRSALALRDSAIAAFARGESADQVKIVALVPARLSVFIDMEQVRYEKIPDAERYRITVDSLVLDQPVVSLDRSQYYETRGGISLKVRDGGVFRELFEQVRLGIGAVEQQIVAEANRQGLIEEGCFAAQEYFENTLRAFGYHVDVRFRSGQCTCLHPTDPPTEPQSATTI